MYLCFVQATHVDLVGHVSSKTLDTPIVDKLIEIYLLFALDDNESLSLKNTGHS